MALAFDATNTGSMTNSNTLSFSHTCTGSNRVLLFTFHYYSATALDPQTVKYNGVDMTLLESRVYSTNYKMKTYYLVNPATGSNTAQVVWASSLKVATGITQSYTGESQYVPIDNSKNDAYSSTSITVNIPNCWVVSFAAGDPGAAGVTYTPTNSYSKRGQVSAFNGSGGATYSYVIGADSNGVVTAGSNTVGWHDDFSDVYPLQDLIVVSLRPVIAEVFSITQASYTSTWYDIIFKKGYGIIVSMCSYVLTKFNVSFKNFDADGWNNQDKQSSDWNNQSKNTTTWTDQTKSSSSWTNESKH